MQPYLRATDIIDYTHPAVRARAVALAQGAESPTEIAHRCFEYVRDRISHSRDAGATTVTCAASEVLAFHTGVCYAKSHLLAALLRANGLPTGFCYQRLRCPDEESYCLHALNAVHLDGLGWYRIDARGNKPGVDAHFTPPVERLAWPVAHPGEADFPEIWPDPLPVVIEALHTALTLDDLWQGLPDVPIAGAPG